MRAQLGGETSPLQARQIDFIHGVSARRIAAHLLEHLHGDTLKMRADLLSQRWWLFYWQFYGEPAAYRLQFVNPSQAIDVPPSRHMPATLQDEDSFEHQFRFEIRNSAAILTVGTFAWDDKQRIYDFMAAAFKKIHAQNIGTLLIDVRSNGGGDDDVWQQGLLRYLADKPYRNGSSYEVRIVPAVPLEPGERLGEVKRGEQAKWFQPELDNPLHFSGKTYVLVGASSYSSTILFANVVQDFTFATLVGVGDCTRSEQSGGVQNFTLPHSKLNLVWPRFVLLRPSGRRQPRLLTPDIPLEDDPYDPDFMLRQVLTVMP